MSEKQFVGVEHGDPKFTLMYNRFMDDEGDLFQSIYEKQLFSQLKRYADNETNEAYPSVARLAKKCFCSPRTIRRSLKAMEERGVIQIKRRRTDNQQNQTNIYRLIGVLEKNEPVITEAEDGVTESGGTDSQSGGGDRESGGGDRESPELDSLELDSQELKKKKRERSSGLSLFDVFFRTFGRQPTPYVREEIYSWIDQDGLSEEAVIYCFELTEKNNAGIGYTRTIIKDWISNNVVTKEDAIAEGEKRKEKGKGGTANAGDGKPSKRIPSETDYTAIFRNGDKDLPL